MEVVWTHTYSPTEAAALTELSEKQIRKEIEHRVLETTSPPRLSFAALVYLRALKLLQMRLGVDDRIRVARCLLDAMESSPSVDTVEVSEILALRIGAVVKGLARRVQRFECWKEKLVTSPEIMGGEATFPDSRLTVRRVGSMLERGEAPETILEDYPYLSHEDLELARLYVRAYPRVGRPPAASPPR